MCNFISLSETLWETFTVILISGHVTVWKRKQSKGKGQSHQTRSHPTVDPCLRDVRVLCILTTRSQEVWQWKKMPQILISENMVCEGAEHGTHVTSSVWHHSSGVSVGRWPLNPQCAVKDPRNALWEEGNISSYKRHTLQLRCFLMALKLLSMGSLYVREQGLVCHL